MALARLRSINVKGGGTSGLKADSAGILWSLGAFTIWKEAPDLLACSLQTRNHGAITLLAMSTRFAAFGSTEL
ncbi:hypothetical protein Mapa_000027 [Marchantia paleacea]|nr:hypothetical protein Mapa_000027 [Marchantia paleacea]